MAITDFHELGRPHRFGKLWMVRATGASPYYLKNDGSKELANFLKLPDSLFITFDNEHLAHEAACLYYSHHQELYPYTVEWAALAIPPSSLNRGEEGSQHMTFN